MAYAPFFNASRRVRVTTGMLLRSKGNSTVSVCSVDSTLSFCSEDSTQQGRQKSTSADGIQIKKGKNK